MAFTTYDYSNRYGTNPYLQPRISGYGEPARPGPLPTIYPDYNQMVAGVNWEAEQRRKVAEEKWKNSPEGQRAAWLKSIENDPSQRYAQFTPQPTPGFEGPVADLLGSLKTGTGQSQDWKAKMDQAMLEIKDAFSRESKATDPTEAFGKMDASDAAFESAGRGLFANQFGLLPKFQSGIDRYNTSMAGTDAAAEAAGRGIIARQYGLLPQYDAAAEAVKNSMVSGSNAAFNRFYAGGGTPTSAGSGAARAYQDIAARYEAPLQQAKIAQRYNILAGEMPFEQQVAATNRSRYGQELALNQGLLSQESNLYGQQLPFEAQISNQNRQRITYQLDKTLQLAQTNRQAALEYMRSMALPDQVQQQILSGNIHNAQQLYALISAVRPTYWQDLAGANPSQPQAYWANAPQYPQPDRYSTATANSGGGYPNDGGGRYPTTGTSAAASPYMIPGTNQPVTQEQYQAWKQAQRAGDIAAWNDQNNLRGRWNGQRTDQGWGGFGNTSGTGYVDFADPILYAQNTD